MSVAETRQQLAEFAIPGVLAFEETASGLVYASITTHTATAAVFLQGAHLTHWQPAGAEPVLFLSSQSEFAPGKAIRGGVPIVFPWFANDSKQDRIDGKPGPSHGFARTQVWTLAFAALVGEDVSLTWTLGPMQISRKLGFDRFRVVLQMTIGRALTLRMTVGNEAEEPLAFEEAFHSYFAVSDVRRVTVTGLEPAGFVDKTANFAAGPAEEKPLDFGGFTDRIYNHTGATCVLHDPVAGRKIVVEKTNSATTVVFNPRKAMPDLPESEWPKMLCVETANASESPVTLAPRQTHTMEMRVAVEEFEPLAS